MRSLLLALALVTACSGPPYVPMEPDRLADDPWTDPDTGGPEDSGAPDTDTDADTDTDTDTDGDTEPPGEPPCSGTDTTPATLTVENRTDGPVELVWYTDECEEFDYRTVVDGGTAGVNTYLSHTWLIRDAVNGTLITWFVVDRVDQTEVIE